MQEIGSLRGAYHAVVFERDCGATADFSARISILPTAKQLRNQAGNIFAADAHNHLDIPLDSHGAMNLPAIWKRDQEVEITYPAKANLS